MRSEFGKLNSRDFIRGLIFAAITAAFGVVYAAVMDADFAFTWTYWQPVLIAATKSGIQAFMGYLALNIFSNSSGQIKPE